MIGTRRRTVRAFTLLEVIAILPLLAILLATLTWALAYQLKISRGLADQANRQEIMHRILRSMRADFLAANHVGIAAFEENPSVPNILSELQDLPSQADDTHRALDATITLSSDVGVVTYYLISETAVVPRSEVSTLADAPPTFFLARLCPKDDIPHRVWSLRDLLMHVHPGTVDRIAAGATTIRLTFESRQALDVRAPIRRRFDTTLRVGGAR